MIKTIAIILTFSLIIAACAIDPKQSSKNTEDASTKSMPEAPLHPIMADTAKQEPATWRCFGTEPFWSVEIAEAKNSITYKPIEGDSITMPYVKPDEKGDIWIFNAAKLKAVIKREKCSDGMSDNAHEYSAKVRLGGKELQGCARKVVDRAKE